MSVVRAVYGACRAVYGTVSVWVLRPGMNLLRALLGYSVGEVDQDASVHTVKLEDVVVRLSQVTDRESLRAVSQDIITTLFPQSECLVFDTNERVQFTVNYLEKDGIIRESFLSSYCVVCESSKISRSDPVLALIRLSFKHAAPLPPTLQVACLPISTKVSYSQSRPDFVFILALVPGPTPSHHLSHVNAVRALLSDCFYHLEMKKHKDEQPASSFTWNGDHCSTTTSTSSVMPSGNDVSNLINLAADLHDEDPTDLQLKIIAHLCTVVECKTGFLLILSDDGDELYCQVVGDRKLDSEIRLRLPSCSDTILSALKEKTPVFLQDLPKEIESEFSKPASNVLCVPVLTAPEMRHVKLLMCLADKTNQNKSFTDEDIRYVSQCFKYVHSILLRSLALHRERFFHQQTQALLRIAQKLFVHLDDVTLLLRDIMHEARNLVQAECCSVFLLDKERGELVAKIFDEGPNSSSSDSSLVDGHESREDVKEVRMPSNQGIAGHVATTGELLNIRDAYSHPLFYKAVDIETGYKTNNILCFPIHDEFGVIGIAELVNKINSPHFTQFDEKIAKAFSVYCGLSIVHSLMYKKVEDAQHRSRLMNELMMYHMNVTDEEVKRTISEKIPKPCHYSPKFGSFDYSPRLVPYDKSVQATMSMFDDLGFISRWKIPLPSLAKFIMTVQKGYRDPPYHNWSHAFSVAHFSYLLLKNLPLNHCISDLETFALFVACLCHDLDHRGTNNTFQIKSKSVLAALYSSEGSVMERHHFAQAMCILSSDGCNILEHLTKNEYVNMLDLIKHIILATDLGNHLREINNIEQMVRDGYKIKSDQHHKLLLSLLMTTSDLSDQSKDWHSAKKVAECICREFFWQGDLEKELGCEPTSMMDRYKAQIPLEEVKFIQFIARPAFRLLGDLFVEADPLVECLKTNEARWQALQDTYDRRLRYGVQPYINSMDIFKDEDLEAEAFVELSASGRSS